jgi:hypothetical protein
MSLGFERNYLRKSGSNYSQQKCRMLYKNKDQNGTQKDNRGFACIWELYIVFKIVKYLEFDWFLFFDHTHFKLHQLYEIYVSVCSHHAGPPITTRLTAKQLVTTNQILVTQHRQHPAITSKRTLVTKQQQPVRITNRTATTKQHLPVRTITQTVINILKLL